MKHIKKLLTLTTLLLTLCGCGSTNNSLGHRIVEDNTIGDSYLNKIERALNNEDANTLKDLFSEYAVTNTDNLDVQISEFIESFSDYDKIEKNGVNTYETSSYKGKIYCLMMHFDLYKDDVTYRLHIISHDINDKEPEKKGVQYIGVINPDKIDESFKWPTYNSDTTGIHIYY